MGFPGGISGKEPAYQCRRHKVVQVWSLDGEDPWRRKWQPTPVFLPGESQGRWSLVGYSPWSCKESDMTEWLTLSLFTHIHNYIQICFSIIYLLSSLYPCDHIIVVLFHLAFQNQFILKNVPQQYIQTVIILLNICIVFHFMDEP